MRGFVIAGTHSGCGKTTITLGVLAALKKKGLKVQPFKAGPDFIDSGLHRLVTGRHSRNLDVWMCGEEYVKECFHKYSANADIAIIEGVMGMYDGEYSTAKLAGLLNLPVILVVDAYGMAESAGAVVKGFREYGSELRVKSYELREMNSKFKIQSSKLQTPNSKLYIAGVIFNRVASDNHFKRLKDSVQVGDSTLRDVTVLGYLPRDLDFEIPHRHLGLTVAEENPLTEKNIGRLADAVLKHIDVDGILNLAQQSSRAAEQQFSNVLNYCSTELLDYCAAATPTVAIAYDKAFCFYYEDNLDLLKNAGAEIVTFSPLSDSAIPHQADAVYIGGGYPELYAKELSENTSMMKSINGWANSGKPIYAECGGLMYLSKGIYDFNGKFFEMAGVFPFETQIPPCPPLIKGGEGGLRPHLGYREIILKEDCILGKKGDKLKGHEFHYSEIVKGQAEGTVPDLRTERSGIVESGLSLSVGRGITDKVYSVRNNHGELVSTSGYKSKNTLASYIHIHFGSNSEIVWNFLNRIKEQ
ncbi:MAG: cobyrinate a,c-diamide synthase [Thermodesulfovibrionales bacterium]|nr:cobyrinate a,c-diamide synthase [Thermodesulfovibrionales bacterium]